MMDLMGFRECSECRMTLIFLPCQSKWIQGDKATYEEDLVWGRDDDFDIKYPHFVMSVQNSGS